MNKKGDLTIRTLVLVAIALVVLIVVLLIFVGGVESFGEKFKEISEGIWGMKEEIGFLKGEQ